MAIQSKPIADVFHTFGTWFTDIDDGTMVRITPSDRSVFGFTVVPGDIRLFQNVTPYECHEIEYEQEIVVTNIGNITINGFKLDIDDMPSDFSTDVASDCALTRLPDRLVLYVYEVTPSRQDLPSTLVTSNPGDVKQQQGPLGGFITRYEFVNVEELGNTSTAPNQTFTAGSDIQLPTKGTPVIYLDELGKSKWTVVEDFSEAGPNSKVFTYDEDNGTVTFGDGVNGAIPPAGKKVILRISIRNGGGKWTYNGIVVPPATDPTSLGMLKAIRKKIFYGATKIAGADAAIVTEVESTLNIIEQQHLGLDGELMGIRRAWSLAYGGEVKITSGPGTVKNTEINAPFVVERGETVEEDDPERDKKFIAWEGAFGQEITGTLPNQTPDMQDQEIAFFSGDQARDGLGGFDGNSGQDYNAQTTPAEMGFFTAPEVYQCVFKVLPIFWITEEIGYVNEDTSTQQIGINPATIEVTLEGYTPNPFYHVEMGFHPDTNQFDDDDDHLYVEDINRTLAITVIANEEGTIEAPIFDDEQITDEDAEGRNKQTIAGPGNHWTVRAWPSEQFSFIYENQDDDTDHPEWFKMTMVCSSKYPDYETHIFGEPLPDFVINWTVVAGTKTTFTTQNVLPDPTDDIVYVRG